MNYYEHKSPTFNLLSSAICMEVRSQSESAGLNSTNTKVPRNLFHELEMYRQKMHFSDASALCCTPSGVSFYSPSSNEIQSDSEGDDSLVSSEESGSSSSSNECTEYHDYDDDLGVVQDLELFEEHNDRLYASNNKIVNNSSVSLISVSKSIDSSNSNSRYALIMTAQSVDCKKGVRFADECGVPLETVRIMTEPSDYPPYVNPAVIRRYRKAALASMSVATSSVTPSSSGSVEDDDDDDIDTSKLVRSTWKITFKQPASEYVKFREILDHQKIALENVMLKNDVGRMIGTIKVANIAFEKRVFIRLTSDGWKSFLDRPATYQSSPSKAYDTFRFDIEIPRDSDKTSRIEFCVCYIANGANEYWDSNDGKNFLLTASAYEQPPLTPPSPISPARSATSTPMLSSSPASMMRDDAYSMDYKNWSKFASWRNLKTDTPYW